MPNGRKSKYEQIQQKLAQQIRQGTLRPGNQLPTEQELAVAYGVSRLTVRQAIGGLATAGLVRSIQGKGSFVADAQTTPGELRTVHLLICSFHDTPEMDAFNSLLLFHMGAEATRRGFGLCLSVLPRHLTFREFIQKTGIPPTFKEGVILCNIRFDSDDLELLEKAGIPYVSMPWRDAVCRGPRVGSDGAAGMRMCIENLLKYGHREIGLINCPVGYTDFQMNFEMYRTTLRAAGIVPQPKNIVCALPYSEAEGRRAADQLFEANPALTALAVFGDQAAAGVCRRLVERKVRIPEEFSVVVHDRYNWLDSLFQFRPSGTRQNIGGLAHALMDTLERQRLSGVIEQGEHLIAPDWINGNSIAYAFQSL